MILLDVNVLLAAHRADHPHHETVRPWFDGLLAGDEAFTVPDTVWASFIRLATNRRIFIVATPLEEAFAFLRATRSQPHHVAVVPGERQLRLFEELCTKAEATGDLTPDAYLAAVAIDNGCGLGSLDRDFARFTDLRWVRPGE